MNDTKCVFMNAFMSKSGNVLSFRKLNKIVYIENREYVKDTPQFFFPFL